MPEAKPLSLKQLLEPTFPAILFRNNPRFKELTGMSPRTVANMDSKGLGPSERVKTGRVVGYPKESFLNWLEARTNGKESANA